MSLKGPVRSLGMESTAWAKVSNGTASNYTKAEFTPLRTMYLFKLSYISLHMKTIELVKIASLERRQKKKKKIIFQIFFQVIGMNQKLSECWFIALC